MINFQLPVSNQTIKKYLETYTELQKCLYDEVEKGNLSKESYLLDYVYNEQDNEVVKQLLERNEPMKVENVDYGEFCPNCDSDLLGHGPVNYCSNCGQRLDWSEYNDE